MSASTPIIEVENLVVEYGKGAKKTRAVNNISFEVNPGETVGFIGANGAGKSTTIKTLMGFLFPTSGRVRLFGKEAGTVESRQRAGYLPEVALYYPFMKARELLELYGGLQGLSRQQLRDRIPPLLDKVGLAGKGEILLKNFSKGMQQRVGIAQSLIAEPELLIFDELSSGLDPLGRHDLRNVLLELKPQGRTIFFSSHELTEVESLCDRVIMIHRGQIVAAGTVRELMKPLNVFELQFSLPAGAAMPDAVAGLNPAAEGNDWKVETNDPDRFAAAIASLAGAGGRVVSTRTHTKSLEDFFIELVREG